MAGPPRSEHDAAESAQRAGAAKYADSPLLYCSSRVVKTKSNIVDRPEELRFDAAPGLKPYHIDIDLRALREAWL